ncbi:hypothetical protein GCM10011514_02850 [Emticicia aquatilis]|uniref:DUF3619 family protein n=1 Tax=Emticicia aquatilis TaxID=1537369 RepID=A0A916YF11_9BACT|nr:hypothetical protein [Emticicia aquatilis]GGD42314.1 hypothetical protein GCM10011514_02850 [Emticicia aquatilis]
MKNQEEIERQIDETLDALAGIERAEPRPFFQTRLEARMDIPRMQQRYAPLPKFMVRPAFVWSFLALVVLLNVGVVIRYSQKTVSEPQDASTFAKEYGLGAFDTNL